MISFKYAYMPAKAVQVDLLENHNRKTSSTLIQTISQMASNILVSQEENYEYTIPTMPQEVKAISIGIDGTCMPMGDTNWREAMCGTISLYDKDTTRMHTIYVANAPEHGKESFKARMDKEIISIKKQFPNAIVIGLADGAKENWSFLGNYTDSNTLDYYHATEYLTKASKGIHPRSEELRANWYQEACHSLKNDKDGAVNLLQEIEELKDKNLCVSIRSGVDSTITYFTNNLQRMNYKDSIDNNLPIGSGVTESACKIIVKQRVCVSGANWSEYGAKRFLPVRAICLTDGRWSQAWNNFMLNEEMVA